MDLTAFRLGIEQARRFEAEAEGATFELRLPSEHAWRIAFETHRDRHGNVMETQAMRAVLDEAVVGWRGVRQRHFRPGAGEEEVPFSAESRALLLDERHEIGDALAKALGARSVARRREIQAERKNSGRASSTS